MSRLIGLAGYARSGKDTVGKALVLQGATRLAFADPLKAELREFCMRYYGMDPSDQDAKQVLRELLVFHGRMMRSLDPDYWVNKVRHYWIDAPHRPFVVTDCRYLNEIQTIVEDGGTWVYVDRGLEPANDEERQSFIEIFEAMDKGVIPEPVYIENDGDVERLHGRVSRLSAYFGEAVGSENVEVAYT